jgi:hypothetical protein
MVVLAFQLKKKTISIIAIIVIAISVVATGYIMWTVENDPDVTPEDTSASDDYYKENLPIFEDICGDGFLIDKYDEECEFGDPAGYECDWDGGCNQNTCECEDSQ